MPLLIYMGWHCVLMNIIRVVFVIKIDEFFTKLKE